MSAAPAGASLHYYRNFHRVIDHKRLIARAEGRLCQSVFKGIKYILFIIVAAIAVAAALPELAAGEAPLAAVASFDFSPKIFDSSKQKVSEAAVKIGYEINAIPAGARIVSLCVSIDTVSGNPDWSIAPVAPGGCVPGDAAAGGVFVFKSSVTRRPASSSRDAC